jgi:hypothetical protein
MMHLVKPDTPATRTLTIVLPESEWEALRSAEPDAIGWLQSQIRLRLDVASVPQRRHSVPSAATADSWWGGDDEY